jgi:hypothetical protein
MVRRIVGVLLSFCLITSIVVCQGTGRQPNMDVPMFSVHAVPIYYFDGRQKTSTSPDGTKTIGISSLDFDSEHGHIARLTVSAGGAQLDATIPYGLNPEVLWSPDSRAFAISGSCCGANGNYESDVFFVRNEKLERIELTALIRKTFGHPVKCGWSESPNVAAIKWIVASHQLLVASEIIHHTNCDSSGTFTAYVVDLSERRVVKVLDQLDVKRLYRNDLGKELLQSDDDCIRRPESCRVGAKQQ